MALSKIQTTDNQVIPNIGRRNLIINGDVQISQRATLPNITSGSNNFGPDRFRFQLNDLGTWELSQSTTVPSNQGFTNSLKLNCTTADTSVAAASYMLLQQRLEGGDLQHLNWGTSSAKNLTWSFWIRSTKTGTVSTEIQHQNSGGTYYTKATTFTISASNTWEKKIIAISSNTAQDIKNHQADGLYVSFWFTAGTDWTGGTLNTSAYQTGVSNNTRVSSSVPNHADSTNNEIYLTGMQLEVGDTATDFEHRSFGEEYRLCQRYFQKTYAYANYLTANVDQGCVGFYATNTSDAQNVNFATPMRAAPEMTIYRKNGGAANQAQRADNSGNYAALSNVVVNDKGITFDQNFSNSAMFRFHYYANAEL